MSRWACQCSSRHTKHLLMTKAMYKNNTSIIHQMLLHSLAQLNTTLTMFLSEYRTEAATRAAGAGTHTRSNRRRARAPEATDSSAASPPSIADDDVDVMYRLLVAIHNEWTEEMNTTPMDDPDRRDNLQAAILYNSKLIHALTTLYSGISHMFSYSRSWALETIDSHTRSRITGSESYFTDFDAALKRDIDLLTNNGFTATLVLKELRTNTDPRTWYIQKAEPQSVPEPEDPFRADNILVLSKVLAKMRSNWESRPDGDDYKDLVEGNARLIFGLTTLYPGIRDTFSHTKKWAREIIEKLIPSGRAVTPTEFESFKAALQADMDRL